ncbi:MAG TPA: NAD(P)H-dependent oxidoreductase [Candidatus Corynebacterium gallistercoris]|uniref:NAD(P)H-dependent oxidoreductase n=1 Tax=Candidatus Corynebacterium gallistercoris TaxID=2838530 RepID=A0A9D1RXL4_9CORY|nr:NAD(P)H-dependent oxidoreductase [Candidatus Corynebacterium gallistercoris]
MNDQDTLKHVTIGIFAGSIREGRTSIEVARWAEKELTGTEGASFTIIDLKEQDLPQLTGSVPPAAQQGDYTEPKAAQWARKIEGFDGFIFATPEYNAGIPGTMKNAFDSIYVEWGGKPVAFVGWGSDGAQTAIKHWHDVAERVGMKVVGDDLHLPFKEAFSDHQLAPTDEHTTTLHALAGAVADAAR